MLNLIGIMLMLQQMLTFYFPVTHAKTLCPLWFHSRIIKKINVLQMMRKKINFICAEDEGSNCWGVDDRLACKRCSAFLPASKEAFILCLAFATLIHSHVSR